ncbi:hypothetical protein BJX63DRAFT_438392 [Aspergillus granulosus]|uniref:Extracellular membrane protein CFEM domain-containing protein n=1 Tax=Aspergillus granulosus TaxID=176169 RepID=A0ABR4GSN7_9EURO
MQFFKVALLACMLHATYGNPTELPACASDCINSVTAKLPCFPHSTCICGDNTLQQNVFSCMVMARSIFDSMCRFAVRDNTRINPAVTTAFGIPAIITSIVRFSELDRYSGVGDVFVAVALVSSIVVGTLEYPASFLGFGKDIWQIPFSNITSILKLSFIIQVFYILSISSYKMVFLYLYRRIFENNVPFRRTLDCLIGVTTVYFLVFSFLVVFHCLPISYAWTQWSGETEGTCLDFNAVAKASAGINILLDLLIMLLPLPQISRLHMGRNRKVVVLAMFLTGAGILAVSIIRLKAVVSFGNSTNPTWDNVATAYWSTIECFTAVICLNIPAVRRFVMNILGRLGFASCGSTASTYKTPQFQPNHPLRIKMTTTTTVTSHPFDQSDLSDISRPDASDSNGTN